MQYPRNALKQLLQIKQQLHVRVIQLQCRICSRLLWPQVQWRSKKVKRELNRKSGYLLWHSRVVACQQYFQLEWVHCSGSERCSADNVDGRIIRLGAITHPSLSALLAPAERLTGWEIALLRLCLRQIVGGIAHLFYQFTDLLCAGSSALITAALGSHAIF